MNLPRLAAALFAVFCVTTAAQATPRTLTTVTNCVVSSLSSPSWYEQYRTANSCIRTDNSQYAPTARITLSCGGTSVDVWYSLPSQIFSNGEALGERADGLFLSQLNNSLNLGKPIKSLTYVQSSYWFSAGSTSTLADSCAEVQAFFGIPNAGKLNYLFGYKL